MTQRIGVRELQNATSSYIKRARDGQDYIVTWHALPAAVLVSVDKYERWTKEEEVREERATYSADTARDPREEDALVALLMDYAVNLAGDRVEAARLAAQAAAELLKEKRA